MQNVVQGTTSDSQKSHEKQSAAATAAAAAATGVRYETGKISSTPQSSNSSPTKSETETFSELQPRFMTDSSESEEDSVSEVKQRDSQSDKTIRMRYIRKQDAKERERERERGGARERMTDGKRGYENDREKERNVCPYVERRYVSMYLS